MKAKKKILSILLAACMLLTFMPTMAFAEDSSDAQETTAAAVEQAAAETSGAGSGQAEGESEETTSETEQTEDGADAGQTDTVGAEEPESSSEPAVGIEDAEAAAASADEASEADALTAESSGEVTTAEAFASAIQAGGTITLGADITFHDTAVLGGDVVLDLNGYTLTYEYTSESVGSGTNVITYAGIYGTSAVDDRYDLTIRDSSDSKTGAFKGNSKSLVYGYFDEVQILGGSFQCESASPIYLSKFTKLTMKDANLSSSGGSQMRFSSSEATSIHIEDCTFQNKLMYGRVIMARWR